MKNEEIEKLKSEAETAKFKLIQILHDLESIGAVKEAKSLETIIIKLEVWQNK
jgi:hypothetical protein